MYNVLWLYKSNILDEKASTLGADEIWWCWDPIKGMVSIGGHIKYETVNYYVDKGSQDGHVYKLVKYQSQMVVIYGHVHMPQLFLTCMGNVARLNYIEW